jgi:transposase-like protein
MDMGRFLIETHLRTGRPIKQLARSHGVNASWLFKLLRRYRLEGEAGLEPRSRRPKHSSSRISDLFEDEIVAIRKELLDFGTEAGAETIHYHMAQRHKRVPSVSTIWRVLKGEGIRHPAAAQAARRQRVPKRRISGVRLPDCLARSQPCLGVAGSRR